MAATSTETKFTRIYRDCHDQLLAYCARRVGLLEADDAVNEVFEVLWRKVDHVDETRALPWLYAVAARTLLHRRRSLARWHRLIDRTGGLGSPPPDEADQVVLLRDRDRMVLDALSRLRAADREILRLAAWEDLAARECADVLGCSVPAAEQRLHRAKKRLAAQLSRSAGWELGWAIDQEGPR